LNSFSPENIANAQTIGEEKNKSKKKFLFMLQSVSWNIFAAEGEAIWDEDSSILFNMQSCTRP